MWFAHLKYVYEEPKHLCEEHDLRVYTSEVQANGHTPSDGEQEQVRYHIGFPEYLVKPIAILLETSPYWGEAHWCEEDGFWLYWLRICGGKDEPIPFADIDKNLKFKLKAYNRCLGTMTRMAERCTVCGREVMPEGKG